MKGPVISPSTFALILIFCLTSMITAHGLNSASPDEVDFSDNDTSAILTSSGQSTDSIDAAQVWQLVCGNKGQYTSFCAKHPYQYQCDPKSGKLSTKWYMLRCDWYCGCEKADGETNAATLTSRHVDAPADTPDGPPVFGDDGHDDTSTTFDSSDHFVDVVDAAEAKYQLPCGDGGQYTSFCAGKPYEYHCDPDSGKGSRKWSIALCGWYCVCKKANGDTSAATLGSRDGAPTNEDVAVAVAARQLPFNPRVPLPKCAQQVSFPALASVNCPPADAACICKSATFVQDQCKQIKDKCSPEEAQSIQLGQTVCAYFGVAIDCAPTHASDDSLSPRGLAKRLHYNYAYICDGKSLLRSTQVEVTRACQLPPHQYHCDVLGRFVYSVYHISCEYHCRCVNTVPNCLLKPGGTNSWWSVSNCISKAETADPVGQDSSIASLDAPGAVEELSNTTAETADGQSTSSTAKKRSLGHDVDIVKRPVAPPSPVRPPWRLWCTDMQQFNDPDIDSHCISSKYGCQGDGNMIHPTPQEEICELACICVEADPNDPPPKRRSAFIPSPFQYGLVCANDQAVSDGCKNQHYFCTLSGERIHDDSIPRSQICDNTCQCIQEVQPNSNLPRGQEGEPHDPRDITSDDPPFQSPWGDSGDHPSSIETDTAFSQSQGSDDYQKRDLQETTETEVLLAPREGPLTLRVDHNFALNCIESKEWTSYCQKSTLDFYCDHRGQVLYNGPTTSVGHAWCKSHCICVLIGVVPCSYHIQNKAKPSPDMTCLGKSDGTIIKMTLTETLANPPQPVSNEEVLSDYGHWVYDSSIDYVELGVPWLLGSAKLSDTPPADSGQADTSAAPTTLLKRVKEAETTNALG